MKKEKCVVCTTETPYTRYTHIDLRKYYVDGAGQLCKKCWIEIYSGKDRLRVGTSSTTHTHPIIHLYEKN